MSAIALWSLQLPPGEAVPVFVRRDFRITNASLGEELEDESARTVIKVTHTPVNPRFLDSDSEYSESDDEELDSDDELEYEDDEDEEDDDEEEEGGKKEKKVNGKADKSADTEDALMEEVDEEEDIEDEDSEDDDEDDDFDLDDEEPVTSVICALTPGRIEQVNLNLTFTEEEAVIFENTGKNTVHLLGNYIDQTPAHAHPHDDYDDLVGDSDEDSDDEDYDEELDSDEFEDMDEDEMAARFKMLEDAEDTEEAKQPAKAAKAIAATPTEAVNSKKRKAEESAAAVGDVSVASTTDGEGLSKNQKKKLAKKQKLENGAAAAAPVAEKKEEAKKDEKKASAGPTKKTLAGGLIIEDKVVGTGPVAKAGKRCGMRYVGKLTNGKQFDANTSGAPFNFRLGVGEVIKGWDQGVAGMAVGGERRITVPPALGYGSQKIPGIPPQSTLVFDVKLLSVK